MTDIEQLKNLFKRAGVQFSVKARKTESVLSIETGDDGVTGYSGFGASFMFTPEGKLFEVQLGEG